MTTWLFAPCWLGRTETPERAVLQPLPDAPPIEPGLRRIHLVRRWTPPTTVEQWATNSVDGTMVELDQYMRDVRDLMSFAQSAYYLCWPGDYDNDVVYEQESFNAPVQHCPALNVTRRRLEALTTELDALEWPTGGQVPQARPTLESVWLPGLGAVGALCWRCGELAWGGGLQAGARLCEPCRKKADATLRNDQFGGRAWTESERRTAEQIARSSRGVTAEEILSTVRAHLDDALETEP